MIEHTHQWGSEKFNVKRFNGTAVKELFHICTICNKKEMIQKKEYTDGRLVIK